MVVRNGHTLCLLSDLASSVNLPAYQGGSARRGARYSARDEALASRRMLTLIGIMQDEVRYIFSGAMPFSVYTLFSGFVSTLLVYNFTFYDDGELTAFMNS